jgi:hypothetical protein
VLNETACLIWRELTGGAAPHLIARRLTDAYDVPLDRAQSSVAAALRAFMEYRLVQLRQD